MAAQYLPRYLGRLAADKRTCSNERRRTISPALQRGSHQSCMMKSPLSSSTSIGIAGSGLPEHPSLLSPNFFMTSTVVLTLSLWPLTTHLTLPPTEQGGVFPFSPMVNLSNRELEHTRCSRTAPGWNWKLSGMP